MSGFFGGGGVGNGNPPVYGLIDTNGILDTTFANAGIIGVVKNPTPFYVVSFDLSLFVNVPVWMISLQPTNNLEAGYYFTTGSQSQSGITITIVDPSSGPISLAFILAMYGT